MRLPAWRVLAGFWAVVVLGVGGGAAVLHWLGPPDAPALAMAEPPAEPPPAVTAEAPPDPPPAPPVATPAEPAAPPATPVAGPPRAPEPPPLAGASPAERAAARPIPAPDPALLEPGPHGPLPRAGADGRTPIRAYGRDFDRRDTRPRIGVVVADIGQVTAQNEAAIRRLPPAVTLALSPYSPRLAPLVELARERGMETLISIPMEPAGYPLNDPGQQALMTGRQMAENLDRLDWVLSRAQGYVGAIGAIGGMRGERFAGLTEAIGAVQDRLRGRGLLYIDPRPGAGPPARAWGRGVDVILDEPAPTGNEIDRRLAELEAIARRQGAALGLAGRATPVLVERIAIWAQGLEQRGLVLAPVSAMIRRPEGLAETGAIQPARTP